MNILFVCSGNAWRSPMAEALLKKFRPDIRVDSAGTHAYHEVAEEVSGFLPKENAEQYFKKIPESIDDKQLADYDLIIVMEPKHRRVVLSKCPECDRNVIVWSIDDPIRLPPGSAERIFHQIERKVKELADSL